MERRARFCLSGAVLALGLLNLPVVGQSQTTSYNYSTDGGMYAAGTGRAASLDKINAANITGHDIEMVLPLLYDLRDADRQATMADANYVAMNGSSAQNSQGSMQQAVSDARQRFNERAQNIWSTISQRLGADKANALRSLVEPQPIQTTAMQSEHITRIDQLLSQWDQQVASSGTTTTTETTTARTTTTTDANRGMAHMSRMSSPVISVEDLVTVLEDRLIAMNIPSETLWLVQARRSGLTEPDIRFVWDRALRIWE